MDNVCRYAYQTDTAPLDVFYFLNWFLTRLDFFSGIAACSGRCRIVAIVASWIELIGWSAHF